MSSTGHCVRLNIGGTIFVTTAERLLEYPNTRLGKLLDKNSSNTGEYFFDRSALLFEHVLNLYRSNTLHIPENVCLHAFLDELTFWEIDTSQVELCCQKKLYSQSELDTTSKSGDEVAGTLLRKTSQQSAVLYAGPTPRTLREKLNVLLEFPNSSIAGLVFAIVSAAFIIVTIVISILGSIPTFQVEVPPSQAFLFAHCNACSATGNRTESGSTLVKIVVPQLTIADAVCVCWFTIEFILRLWAAPNFWKAIRQPLAIIDLAAILPFYIELVLQSLCICNETVDDMSRGMLTMRILRIMRVFRVARVLKLARYSANMRVMGSSLRRSLPELTMMSTFVFMSTILFASTMYYIEDDDADTPFVSIPEAAYWCVITLTTVGYGDVTPSTIAGKLLATVVAFTGVIILAFPISIIVNKFNTAYAEFNEEKRHREDGILLSNRRKSLQALLRNKIISHKQNTQQQKLSINS